MNHLKIFEEFVKVSDYRKWSKYANMDFYKDVESAFKDTKDHDKNFNRIYFDLKVDNDSFEIDIPQEISDWFNWFSMGNDMEIVDYNKGICRDKDGREMRIGRLLNKYGEEGLLKTYNQSKTNTLKNVDDLQVVISRHPYDIIGMSTNRGWTTCHDLNDKRYGGEHLHGISNDLRDGVLVAYLIRKSDKNIKNPISRCLINNYYGRLSVDDHVYGTYVREFVEFLENWCGGKKLGGDYGSRFF